jgi:hypothetical protein
MRRSGELSKALLVTRFTAPPIESPSMSGVGDFTTSIRSMASALVCSNWYSRVDPAEAAFAARLPLMVTVLRF